MSATRLSAAVRPALPSASALHLARRFTSGIDEQVLRDIRAAGSAGAWFDQQLRPGRIPDPRGDAVLGWYPRLKDAPAVAWKNNTGGTYGSWEYGQDLVSCSLARQIVSRRQVKEVMVDFWSNLLHIPAGEDRSFPWRRAYDDVIRANALGSFRLLLRRAVVHPAMSGWLNNSSNTRRGINENLGRELLELYTVGRPAGYDEDDVQGSARLLTGFHVNVFQDFAASYVPDDHWVGRVEVLGFTHANSSKDGRAAVNAYLDHLARHPATAKRIARRLCVRFVADEPSSAIVAAVAKAYRTSDTSIPATLRALVKHPDFARSRRTKVRTPVEDVVCTARVLGMRPTGSGDQSFARQLLWMSQSMGQTPFGWPRPDGYPETSSTWTSPARILRTWDIHYSMAGGWWHPTELSVTSKASSLPTTWPRTLGELVEHQSRMLLGTTSTSRVRQAVATVLDRPESSSFASAGAVSDWAWTVIRSTVLNTPEGMLR
jgi:hypothetical protein